jgi:hypothetical protein
MSKGAKSAFTARAAVTTIPPQNAEAVPLSKTRVLSAKKKRGIKKRLLRAPRKRWRLMTKRARRVRIGRVLRKVTANPASAGIAANTAHGVRV